MRRCCFPTSDLVRQGHVRYVGVSNLAAWQIAKALGIAERTNAARFQPVRAYYTVDVTLSADELKTLDAASKLPSEYPGWMFGMQGAYRGKLIARAKRRD